MRWLVTIGLVAGCGDVLGLEPVDPPVIGQVPSLVNSNSAVGVTTNELDVALPSATHGDLIVVAVCFSAGARIASVSDVDTPAYTELANKGVAGELQAEMFWTEVDATTAPFNVRVLFELNVATPDVRVAEYSNVKFPNPVDNATDNSVLAASSVNLDVMVSKPPAVVVAATCVSQMTTTIDTGFKIHELTAPNGDALADLDVADKGSITATANQSDAGTLILQLVAFTGGTPQ